MGEAILKTHEPFTYGVAHDITNVCCKNQLQRRVICLIDTNFSYYYVHVLLNMTVKKKHADKILRIIILSLFTLNFVYSNSCCPHAAQILPKMYAPHKTLSMPALNVLNHGLQDLRM
jgi:hypothetical protein